MIACAGWLPVSGLLLDGLDAAPHAQHTAHACMEGQNRSTLQRATSSSGLAFGIMCGVK